MVGRQKGFRTAADGIWEDLVFRGTWLGRLNRCSMANETLGWEMRSWGVMESWLRTDDLMGYEGLEPDHLGELWHMDYDVAQNTYRLIVSG